MLDFLSSPAEGATLPPVAVGPEPPDLLTQILLGLRLDGVEYGRCVMHAPWAVAFPALPSARFHFVGSGGAWLRTRSAILDGTPSLYEQDRFNDLGLFLRSSGIGVPEIIHFIRRQIPFLP